jgi:hypothetical protein
MAVGCHEQSLTTGRFGVESEAATADDDLVKLVGGGLRLAVLTVLTVGCFVLPASAKHEPGQGPPGQEKKAAKQEQQASPAPAPAADRSPAEQPATAAPAPDKHAAKQQAKAERKAAKQQSKQPSRTVSQTTTDQTPTS